MFATAPGPVLVVDDNDTARYGKCRVLRQAGFDVLEAGTGEEALRIVGGGSPRLVLLDVQLPGISGWEVCRRIKGDPATSSVIVLQVSATYVHGEDTVRALEGGADASLAEPIEPTVLVATVNALLRARNAEDALREALGREQSARLLAEEANHAKDAFLATLSHELRTPLGAILTWVTLLRAGSLDETKSRRGLEAIERNARLQTRMIEDLLDVSRIISGKLRIEVGPVDLVAVVEGAADGVRPAADAKGVRVETAITPGVGFVAGDPARLQQIVSNLVSNAVKFTPKDGRVTLRLDAPEGTARIQVSDDGRGIEPSFLPHIFERFRQADSSSTRAEGGLGLGLAIVRHLTELHGGSVLAASAGTGRGSTFTVLLPRTPAGPAPALPIPMVRFPPAHGLPRLDGVRVLVVDDEADARDAIVAVLQRCGADVAAVGSVSDARGRLSDDGIDIVVSDIAMPGEDGYRLIETMRGGEGSAARTRTPALALTAYANAQEQRRIMAAGFDVCLAKPIEAVALAMAVARLAKLREEV